jgi:hypothetical protein
MKRQNMKTWICKATLAATLTCLALGGATVAQAAGCSNATLTGKYGQTISGELLTRVSYGCIPADHGRKPGASEHRQQWHSRGQRWSH